MAYTIHESDQLLVFSSVFMPDPVMLNFNVLTISQFLKILKEMKYADF